MIINALTISLIILFIHACTWDGHIFEFVRTWIDEKKKISKPVYNCPICMTPYYGTVLWFIFFKSDFKDWFLTIGAAAGFSVLYVLFIEIKDSSKNSLTNGKHTTHK
jgi:hypothetical protein